MNTYWAASAEDTELLSQLEKRIRDYHEDLRVSGLLSLYERSYRAYYGGRVTTGSVGNGIFDNARLSSSGRQGEKTRLKANHFRNLIQHWIQLVTSQRRTMQARASNSDYRSQAQTIFVNGLLDHYQREKGLDRVVKEAVELCFAIYGEMFIHEPWNPQAGRLVDAPLSPEGEQAPQYEGDIEYQVLSPLDTIRDFSSRSSKASDWYILRFQRNKWDLAAENPGAQEDILRIQSNDSDLDPDNRPSFSVRSGNEPVNEDTISEYVFYHRKTSALPQGRMIKFVKGVKLFDGPLPYKNVPVRRLCASPLADTIYGFTLAWDLLSVQDGIDTLHTTLMSNNKTFGIQSIWARTGDSFQVSTLGQGMQLLKSDEEPKAIQLTKSAPESYNYLDILEKTQERLSGIPATVRGNPEANLRTGNALALVVSQAIQFASSADAAISYLHEELGMDLIDILRDFTPQNIKRVVSIVGKANRSLTKEFYAQDELSDISRVSVEEVNPLSKTIAGRVEMANNMLQQGLLKNAEDYQQILATGQMDSTLEGSRLEELAMQAENEDLREGKPVQAILTEKHHLHIQKHTAVIADPEAKKNPTLVQATLMHIQEHLNLWRQMPPDLLMVLGMPSAMPMPPQAPGAAPAGPAGTPPPQPPAIEEQQLPDMPEGTPEEAQANYDGFKGGL